MVQQKIKQFTPGLIPALLANNPGYKISSLGSISKEFTHESYIFSQYRKIMFTLMKWSSFQKNMSKFKPKKHLIGLPSGLRSWPYMQILDKTGKTVQDKQFSLFLPFRSVLINI